MNSDFATVLHSPRTFLCNRWSCIAVLFAAAGSVCAADFPVLSARDVFAFETAGDAQISPDGSRIVYVRYSYDIATDRARRNLWMVDVNGGQHRPLASDANNYSAPRFSPDGGRIAYVSNADGKPQLYVRWLGSGENSLLTNLTETPGDLTWSPDGRWLAFTQFVPEKKPPLATPPEKPEGAQWAPPVTVIDSVVYRADGKGYLKSGYSHVFIVSAEGGAVRQLTDGPYDHAGRMAFLPDSRRLVISTNRAKDWEYDPVESELFSIEVDTGKLQQLTNRKGPDRSPAVSPDGRWIAYLGFDDRQQGYQVTQLYVMDVASGKSRALSAQLDRDVEQPLWAADSKGIYFSYDDRGLRRVGYSTLTGQVREVASGLGSEDVTRPYTGGGFSVASNGRVAFVQANASTPGDVAVVAGGKSRVLTRLNENLLGHRALGTVERVTWKSSHDGRDVEGWLMKPPHFDANQRYPLILEIHGGPFQAYGPSFSIELQRYAAAGYMVLYANPRGSTSYGEEFGNLIHLAYPSFDYDDLMSGVDAAIARGGVDPNNLFVTGGSGGGVLTAWIVGKTARFRAAVVAKPVINWTSFVLTADNTNFFYRYWFPAPPWEAQADYWRRSPLSLVGNVSTPTMLITGEADYRTPIGETEQFYQALKLRKVPTAMVRIPEASHGMTARPSNLVAKTDNILAWFERYRTH